MVNHTAQAAVAVTVEERIAQVVQLLADRLRSRNLHPLLTMDGAYHGEECAEYFRSTGRTCGAGAGTCACSLANEHLVTAHIVPDIVDATLQWADPHSYVHVTTRLTGAVEEEHVHVDILVFRSHRASPVVGVEE
jgi:hypothetical protein